MRDDSEAREAGTADFEEIIVHNRSLFGLLVVDGILNPEKNEAFKKCFEHVVDKENFLHIETLINGQPLNSVISSRDKFLNRVHLGDYGTEEEVLKAAKFFSSTPIIEKRSIEFEQRYD